VQKEKKSMRFTFRRILGTLTVGVAVVAVTWVVTAEPPAPPKVSTFAPAKDVAAQIDVYMARLEESVASEDEFKEAEAKVAKDANTMILLALASGLHDEHTKYKAAGPAIVKASQDLAKAKGFAATKAAVAAIKKALEATDGNAAELKWVKSASLPDLMKQVPLINSRLKRNLRGPKFKSKAKDNAGDATTIAVIAQGSLADTSETKNADEVKKWHGFCIQMRDAATGLNKAIRAADQAAADKALGALNQSCDDCHAVFHKEAEKESGKE
jgi:hypothetical protein